MIRALVCAAGATVALAAQAQGPDLKKAEELANQVCAACHAADGNSTAPANPKIAGQIPEYLHKQLVDFKPQGNKKPARESAIMAGMVANLSEADMKGLAAFYAGQKLNPAAAADKNLAGLGQKIWRGGNPTSGVPRCAGCHGPLAPGCPRSTRLPASTPSTLPPNSRLSGRRPANDPNGMMRSVTARMTEREIRAVAEYAAGLR
jgi:cytochrome c553